MPSTIQKRTYRRWPMELIQELLREAKDSNVYATARRHGLHPVQLYKWRRDLNREQTTEQRIT